MMRWVKGMYAIWHAVIDTKPVCTTYSEADKSTPMELPIGASVCSFCARALTEMHNADTYKVVIQVDP